MRKIVKTALIGYPGVGKSTLVKLLSGKKNLKTSYDPTIGLDFGSASLKDDFQLSLWDIAGQEQFEFLWDSFLRGSSLICVVTDSSTENVKKTKQILNKYKNYQGAKVIAIANKQDTEGAMDPKEIENYFGVETIGMVAVDQENKRMLFNQLTRIFS
ncbi:MAG: GTP-binding protein [Candidatus Helarchaeota archaeon]|nr:GTP-binding protein [Candidatus Helarchaeota archaeon]